MSKFYSTIKLGKYTYVLTEVTRTGDAPKADFEGTGMGLLATLNKGETLRDFLDKRLPVIKQEAEERAVKAIKAFR